MVTDKLRIQAYIEPELHQRLKDFQQERGLKESPALDQILREYFGMEPQSSIPTERIEEIVEEKVSQIKRELVEKLPSRSEIDRRVTEEINARIEEQSEFWHNKLAERIYIVEQRLDALKQRTNEQFDFLVNRLPESLPELPSESPTDNIDEQALNHAENPSSQEVQALVKDLPEYSELPRNSSSELPEFLNAANLARRLGISKSVISRRKTETNFEEWSRSKDPAGIGWRFPGKGQRFFSVSVR